MSKIAFVPIIPNNFFLPTPTIFLVAAQSCKLNCILSNVYSKLQYNQTKPMIRALNNKFCEIIKMWFDGLLFQLIAAQSRRVPFLTIKIPAGKVRT